MFGVNYLVTIITFSDGENNIIMYDFEHSIYKHIYNNHLKESKKWVHSEMLDVTSRKARWVRHSIVKDNDVAEGLDLFRS